MPPFWHRQPSRFSPPLHERFTFQMPAGTQESRGGSRRAGGLIWSSSRRPQFAPPLRSSPPHLSSTERGNKSDRVQSLSLICQWGEWAGKRLSDRPAVACPPCQLYWIMTRQEVACYEPRGGRRRREISRAWFFPAWGDGAEKQPKWNLSVCKAHDVFYEVMGFEKILDRLWWKDELLPGVRWCYTSCNRCTEGSRLRYET